MRKFLVFLASSALLTGGVEGTEALSTQSEASKATSGFKPYTGRITSKRVRMRLNPSLDSQVLRDFDEGDLVLVLDESSDEFLAIQAPAGTESYVFRTFVLDGQIEGSHVNVRLSPDLSSPVVAQLHTGYKVNGTICPNQSKWLKIAPPESVRFYVSRDYVEHVGGPDYLAKMEARQSEVKASLSEAIAIRDEEMRKSFEGIDFDLVSDAFLAISQHYSDFPEACERAEEELACTREEYLKRKIDFLEERAELASASWDNISTAITGDLDGYQSKLDALEAEIAAELGEGWGAETTVVTTEVPITSIAHPAPRLATDPTSSLRGGSRWVEQEQELYARWAMQNEGEDLTDYYADQALGSHEVRGILERFDRPVKNKPGDYILLDTRTHRTLGYVYSTMVDLHNEVGQEVTLQVSDRPNHNFAFPAYFALSAE
jgi:hypothetical protein